MTYRPLSLICECGVTPDHVDAVGLTTAHQLVVHWFCSGCHKRVYMLKPLSDCWRDCPEGEQPAPAAETGEFEFGPEDVSFLHRFGVRLLAEMKK